MGLKLLGGLRAGCDCGFALPIPVRPLAILLFSPNEGLILNRQSIKMRDMGAQGQFRRR